MHIVLRFQNRFYAFEEVPSTGYALQKAKKVERTNWEKEKKMGKKEEEQKPGRIAATQRRKSILLVKFILRRAKSFRNINMK